jgi:hypothetical protein
LVAKNYLVVNEGSGSHPPNTPNHARIRKSV